MIKTIFQQLQTLGNEQTIKTYLKHGCQSPMFGVKVADLKKIIRKYKLKNNHALALALYDTGNYDAMYLAGLIADSKQLTKEQVLHWQSQATSYIIGNHIVAPVTAEAAFAREIAHEFIKHDDEITASTGYCIFNFYVALVADDQLNLNELINILDFIQNNIHQAKNRTRYAMNGFVIAVGTHVLPLSDRVYKVAETIGKVTVDMGSTYCKVPLATEYIKQAEKMGRLGKKRKQARC